MAVYEYNLSLNGKRLPVSILEYVTGERTYYDISFEDYTLTIYKDTLYTWASDDPQQFSNADIQSLGEQIDNPQP